MRRFAKFFWLFGFVAVWAVAALVAVSQAVQIGFPVPPPVVLASDVDHVVYSGNTAYAISSIANDSAFIDRIGIPNTFGGAKADRILLGILSGSRGTRGFDICFGDTQFMVADTPLNQVSAWKNEYPSAKAGDKRVAIVSDIDIPQTVRCVGNNVYVTAGVDEARLVQIAKTPDKDEYKIAARLELSQEGKYECRNPRSMVVAGDVAYVACAISNTVLKVGFNPLRVIAAVKTNNSSPPGEFPYDIAVHARGDKTWVYTANLVSDNVSFIEDQGGALKPGPVVPVPPLKNPYSGPMSVEASPDGAFVHTANSADQSVTTICAADSKSIATWYAYDTGVSFRPAELVAQHPTQHFMYVFEGGRSLWGHSLGNLYLQHFGRCKP